MFYVKYMPYRSAKNASRNRRELAAAAEYGFETVIFSNDKSDPGGAQRQLWDGTTPMHPGMSKAEKVPKILRNYLRVWYHTAKLPDGVWSCHDLGSLRTAWLVTRFRHNKPQLIYDSHEFEMGRNTTRTPRQWRSVARWERFLMRRCAFSIMVNDTIADETQRIHKLEERPVVVRSTPENWALDAGVIAQERKDLLRQISGGAGAFLVMYHGALTTGRGIETLLRVTAENEHVRAVVLGSGSEAYLNRLQALASELGVTDRVLFHPAVPQPELWKYVGAADLSLMMIEGKAKSYYYALPNKFFESIQSLTPIVASDFPEMKRLIDEYDIGLTCDPNDLDAVCACVDKMRTDKAFDLKCRQNLDTAKAELCWEREKKRLIQAFERYL